MHKILVGKPEGKKLLARTRSRWKDNIRLDIMEIGWEIVKWMHLAKDRNQGRAAANTCTFGFHKTYSFN
jgi:hypothetical protein